MHAGEKLGPYELLAPIGAGGMGEVWKARDTRLDRIAALKFSQARFSDRFEGEARIVAALNHPNIAQIYDVSEDYLVMEFVEGEPVRAAENARALLDIAVQIADGLAAAHAAGVVHRDLKPDNILVTKDRRVKILDFGLARRQATPSDEGTRAMTVTDPGTIVGTIAYMSPEQARGRDLDHRSDQFSLGLILYELATGRRAFQRDSAAETMTAIIREEAEPLPADLPAPVRWTIERCLAKDPDQRYDSTRDLYRELRQTLSGLSQTLREPAAAAEARPHARPRWVPIALAALALAAGALLGAWWRSARRPAAVEWTGTRLGGPAIAFSPRISPDGQMLALLALVNRQTQVAIMKPDGDSWNVLTHDSSNGSSVNVSWARDGSRLYFDRLWGRPAGVYSIPPLGGEPTQLIEDAWAPQALPDGSLVALKRLPSGHDQAFHFWPDSDRSEPLPAYLEPYDVGPPLRAFADGKEIVFIGATDDAGVDGSSQAYIVELSTRKARLLGPQAPIDRLDFQLGLPLAPTPDGHGVLLLSRRGNSFELIRVERSGKPGHTPVLSFSNGLPPFYADVAPDGSIYVDSVDMTPTISRFTVDGKFLAESAAPPPSRNVVLPLSDRRALITGPLGDRLQPLEGAMGTDFHPFLQRDVADALVMSAASDEVVLLLGPPGKRRIGFASVHNGAVRREVPVPGGNAHTAAFSPELGAIYYSADGVIYSMPETGGTPARVTDGMDFAIDPGGRMLVAHDRRGLARVRLPSAAAAPIILPAGMRLALVDLSPAAVDARGRILLNIVTPQDFDYKAAVCDSGRITVIAIDRPGDTLTPGWTPEGDIIAVHDLLRSSLWRFRSEGRK